MMKQIAAAVVLVVVCAQATVAGDLTGTSHAIIDRQLSTDNSAYRPAKRPSCVVILQRQAEPDVTVFGRCEGTKMREAGHVLMALHSGDTTCRIEVSAKSALVADCDLDRANAVFVDLE